MSEARCIVCGHLLEEDFEEAILTRLRENANYAYALVCGGHDHWRRELTRRLATVDDQLRKMGRIK